MILKNIFKWNEWRDFVFASNWYWVCRCRFYSYIFHLKFYFPLIFQSMERHALFNLLYLVRIIEFSFSSVMFSFAPHIFPLVPSKHIYGSLRKDTCHVLLSKRFYSSFPISSYFYSLFFIHWRLKKGKTIWEKMKFFIHIKYWLFRKINGIIWGNSCSD